MHGAGGGGGGVIQDLINTLCIIITIEIRIIAKRLPCTGGGWGGGGVVQVLLNNAL